jgi:histone H3/H4
MKEKLLPLSPMERIMKKAGASRVSLDAMEELRLALEEHGDEISRHALKLSEHAGRRTIRAEDIRLALKK